VTLEEQVKSELIQIIHSCQQQLYRRYEKSTKDPANLGEGSEAAMEGPSAPLPDLAAYRPVDSPPEDAAIFDLEAELQVHGGLLSSDFGPIQTEDTSDSGYGSMPMLSHDVINSWYTKNFEGETFGNGPMEDPQGDEDSGFSMFE
jgi:hypothetical protein